MQWDYDAIRKRRDEIRAAEALTKGVFVVSAAISEEIEQLTTYRLQPGTVLRIRLPVDYKVACKS